MSKTKSQFYNMAISSMLCDNGSPNFTRLLHRYSLLAKNRYRWLNLPSGIESRHIEEYLYEHGAAMLFEDETLGKLVLPASETGSKNVYGDSLSYTVSGYGYTRIVSTDDGVIIRNNDDMLPTIKEVIHYCKRIDELEYAIQKNLDQQNSPYLFICNKNTEMSVKNIMKKIANKEDAIFMDKTLTEDGIVGVMKEDISKPYIGADLQKAKLELEKELLTLLGLNTVINKESGMAVDELNSNNTHIEMCLDIEFKNRQLAAELINEKFGLNVQVERVLDLIEPSFNTTLESKEVQDNVE